MHSKVTKSKAKGVFRMTPYLITAAIAFPMAAHAAITPEQDAGGAELAAVQEQAAPQAEDQAIESEIPAPTIDTDGDGNMDAWDRNADEKPDAWDTDGDGRPDLLDDDGDGKPD